MLSIKAFSFSFLVWVLFFYFSKKKTKTNKNIWFNWVGVDMEMVSLPTMQRGSISGLQR